MLPIMRLTRLPVGLPPAGARVIFVGDSIFDHTFRSLGAAAQRQGKMADALRQQFGWVLLNANKVAGGVSNEAILCPSLAAASGITLTRDSTHAGGGGSAWAAKCASNGTAGGIVFLDGDAGGLRMGMRGGETYTLSFDYWLPTTTTGTWLTAIEDQVGAGGYLTTSLVFTKANSWQHATITRTIRAGATEAFARIVQANGPANGDVIWVDNTKLECNSAETAFFDIENSYRSGVANRLLQLTDNDGVGNALNLLGTNVIPNTIAQYMPLDMVVIFLGVNDYGYSVTTGASTASTKSRTTWRAALTSMMQQLTALFPWVRIVLCSLTDQAVGAASTTAAPNWGIAGGSKGGIYMDMNRITAEVAATYGAVCVDLSGITGGTNLDDGTHPTLAGSDAMVVAFKKAFGQ